MQDRRTPGNVVILVGVLLVALRWIIPLVSDVELSTTWRTTLSSVGAVITLIGLVMVVRAQRPADTDDRQHNQMPGRTDTDEG